MMGELVRYCYIERTINGTMRQTKESIGIVIASSLTHSVLDSETGQVHDALFIVEILHEDR